MSGRHTPPPWEAVEETGTFDIFDEGGRLLAILHEKHGPLPEPQFEGNGYLVYEEHVANARLMATAPEMLAVLKRLIEHPNFARAACDCGEPGCLTRAISDVIAKATGQ